MTIQHGKYRQLSRTSSCRNSRHSPHYDLHDVDNLKLIAQQFVSVPTSDYISLCCNTPPRPGHCSGAFQVSVLCLPSILFLVFPHLRYRRIGSNGRRSSREIGCNRRGPRMFHAGLSFTGRVWSSNGEQGVWGEHITMQCLELAWFAEDNQ